MRNDPFLELLNGYLILLALELLDHGLRVLEDLVGFELEVVEEQVGEEWDLDVGQVLGAESILFSVVMLDDLDFVLDILQSFLKQVW